MSTSSDITTKYVIPRLNATNYLNWRFRLEMLLKEKGIWHTINEERPAEVTPDWTKADEKALATISLMIDDDQIQHIRTCKYAKDAWIALREFHERDTSSSKVRVLCTIMRQRADENSDMEVHVNRMNELFQQLLALGDELNPEFIMSATLLGSLPSSYDSLITTLEARSEAELSSSFVRSKIIEEYRRRKDREGGDHGDSQVMKLTVDGTKKSMVCYFCKRKGHLKSKCTQYANWKVKKGLTGNQNKSNPSPKANIVKSNDASDELLFLIGRANGWILDSGATCHVCCKYKNFIEFDG